MEEKWVIQAKRADFAGLAAEFGVDPLTIRLMVNRGVSTREEIRRYLNGTAADEYDPALMKGAGEAARLLWEAIRENRKIFIASDFDVDGIFSGEILWEGIREAGGICQVRAPHRVKEGYGVNPEMVRSAWEDGFRVMITCDNGIAAFEACEEAKRLGMTVIVTDHHQCPRRSEEGEERVVLPEADVIVNPHQPGCEYPFKGICGAAVAYKVMEMFFRLGGSGRGPCDRFLEYVAIATVADVMDLRDENRIFVREGLARLPNTENHGLRALIRLNKLDAAPLTAYHIGFILGPSFNSAGRLETVDQAFRLLQAGPAEAEALASRLKILNDERKLLTNQGVEDAVAWIEAREELPRVLVVPLPACHESIVGIVAGRIRERYSRPVFILTRGQDSWKGSGRSLECWDMFEHMQPCRDLLLRFGGHPMAAGLSLEEENIPAFTRRINENTGLTPEDLVPVVRIDAAMPIDYVTEELLAEFSLLEPCGKGNTRPLFAEKNFRVRSARILGKNRNVLKLQVENEAGCRMEAIRFGDPAEFEELVVRRYGEEAWKGILRGYDRGVLLSFCYYPEINEYMGMRSLQIVITHMM